MQNFGEISSYSIGKSYPVDVFTPYKANLLERMYIFSQHSPTQYISCVSELARQNQSKIIIETFQPSHEKIKELYSEIKR